MNIYCITLELTICLPPTHMETHPLLISVNKSISGFISPRIASLLTLTSGLKYPATILDFVLCHHGPINGL